MMSKEKLMTILLAPCISEKANGLQQDLQYVFKVKAYASKQDIAAAVEELFKVKVEKVRVCNVKGKNRKFGSIEGRKKDWKKAYVTLQEGQAIDLGGA
jgi:large subunit ribosomal protein L23